MSRILPVLLLLIASAAHADPPPELVALERAVHKVIDPAEPSIASVLISRSKEYANLGEGPSTSEEGRLGSFNPGRLRTFGDGPRRELVKRLDLADPETVPESYGSGVVIDERGYLLTNYHVIEEATKIYVRLSGENRGSYADILAADKRSDLAVLRLITPPANLKPLPFGDGSKVRRGDMIFVLATPFDTASKNASPSASWGFVSKIRDSLPGPTDETKRAKALNQYKTMIQTDARLNRVCSGGALLNLNGELVGLTTSLASLTGGETSGGYAIPIDANVRKMIDILKRGDEIEYGFLGVTVGQEDRTGGRGVMIGDVAAGMPAARAGMRTRDIVTALNGNPVREQEDLFYNISAALAGTEVEIEALRDGSKLKFKVRLAKANHSEPRIVSNRPKPVFGLLVEYPMTSNLSFDSNPPEGVVITSLEPGSPAEKYLKEWKERGALVVVAVNGKAVRTPAEFYGECRGKSSLAMDVVEVNRESEPVRKRVTLP
jgi:serine protease Do